MVLKAHQLPASPKTNAQRSNASRFGPMVSGLLAQSDLIGAGLRTSLERATIAQVLLPRCSDPLLISGAPGTGKHMVAGFLHDAATHILGRGGRLVYLYGATERKRLAIALGDAIAEAKDGTLVLDRFESFTHDERRLIERVVASSRGRVLVLALSDQCDSPSWPRARLDLLPVSQRGDDLGALIECFLEEALTTCGQQRLIHDPQELTDVIVAQAQRHGVSSVAELRSTCRQLVFEALATDDASAALASHRVQAWLNEHTDRGPVGAGAPSAEALGIDPHVIEDLASVHGVDVETLLYQVHVVSSLVEQLNDAPRSFRNIMDRTDDIRRLAIWLHSGADSQAEFRKSFGDARFMQPSKSSAWAFFNAVHKRD